ncbi:MAG: ADP-ribosylglycohydrolase family protein [Candidatus Promineifilaceae bacterium]
MIGSITGDIVGSIFERNSIKTADFPLFIPTSRYTDDTVLTVTVAEAIVKKIPYGETIKDFAHRYPHAGYGHAFYAWAHSEDSRPYNSRGNGSAMRVSPVGFAFNTLDEVLQEARRSAEITHNQAEGIRGAQATALSVFLARKGENKKAIKEEIGNRFRYDLNRSLKEIRNSYRFDVSCQGSVPESIIAFLESVSVEDAKRKAISLGGDSDTMACIAGGIAKAYFREIPDLIVNEVQKRLPDEFLTIIDSFHRRYGR